MIFLSYLASLVLLLSTACLALGAPSASTAPATFNTTLTVDSIKETGKITVTYRVTEGKIHLSCGPNSVTVVIDQSTPNRSTFINATIPAMKDDAEKILTDIRIAKG